MKKAIVKLTNTQLSKLQYTTKNETGTTLTTLEDLTRLLFIYEECENLRM